MNVFVRNGIITSGDVNEQETGIFLCASRLGGESGVDAAFRCMFTRIGHVTRYFPYQEDLPPRKEPFVEVYWCISGAGRFFLRRRGADHARRRCLLPPGNERHYHEIVEEPWEYRWLTFAGPLAEPLLKSYQYPHKCFHAGPCPRELYMRLETLMREKTDYNYRESVAVICSILARFGGSGDTTSPEAGLTGRAKDVCSIHYQDPTFDINTLSSILNVNRWTLRRAFRRISRPRRAPFCSRCA